MTKFTSTALLAGLMILHSVSMFSQQRIQSPQNQTKCWIEKDFLPSTETIKGTTSIFTENFSGGTFPPVGWAISGDGQANWTSSSSGNSGGAPPEARFNWNPEFVGNSKLVTPAISTSGLMVLNLEFKHMIDHFEPPYSVLCETTSNGGITWNEVWSVINPTGSVGPATVNLIIDNSDVGSDNFQLAFTFSGNSYNINYWYIDDISLAAPSSYDASVSAIFIPAVIPVGNSVTPGAIVNNLGSQTVSFDVTFEILQGLTPVFTAVESVTNLQPLGSFTLSFDSWTAVAGSYTAQVTTNLAGDENPANDILSVNVEVLEGVVSKKPLFEVFTSSTCMPCAQANPIIDSIFADNPNEYSLIKYQMNWPGIGDPYYTAQAGVRGDYYGVVYVPDFYGNGMQDDPFVFDQAVFYSYAQQITTMSIDLTTSIDDNYVVNVEAIINPLANYAAGLKAHIVVVEKITVDNVGINGETEFHQVMMAMIPDATGTTLGALSSGVPVTISGSYDMNQTFMEQPNDLAVVVFVQNALDKSIIQSETQDIVGSFPAFNVTFNVTDSDGNAVGGAEIFVESIGFKTTDPDGQAAYIGVVPGSYSYNVSKAGLEPGQGSFDVTDQDITINAVLNIPDYYFYEDFEIEPTGWTKIYSGSNSVYWDNGMMVLANLASPTNLMLISPQIDLSLGETLSVEVGCLPGTTTPPNCFVGTVSDPGNPDSFSLLEVFTPPMSGFEFFSLELTSYPIVDSYLAFKYDDGGLYWGKIYIETVKIADIYTGLEEMIVSNQISIYPNPAKEMVNINSATDIKSIKVYNYSGELIKNEAVSGNFWRINTSNYNSGIYLLMVEKEHETITQRFVVE